ncbi:CoA transferase family III [Micromonospora kangleipakensis]|uniref:CoA transferase family III n=1 Tax=Micromonospora kangleipakensis TaxID=1077942 RepID=A0A4Q8BEA3_9ACTN|nr:CoA transferase [Micromonospora kangleipakensis]RZU76257.1 CoA transferase family III [Micromonospora kangleipakensis]
MAAAARRRRPANNRLVEQASGAAVRTAWTALGGDPAAIGSVDRHGPAEVLTARLPVAELAVATVAAAGLAAAELARSRGLRVADPVPVDTGAVATAFTSERHLRVDGTAFEGFAPLSRFWPAADGWVRTHANYPHHRDRLLTALGFDPSRTDDASLAAEVADRIRAEPAVGVEEALTAVGGLAVAVRTPQHWSAHPQSVAVAREPLVGLRLDGPAAPRRLPPPPECPLLPAAGVRVLDLTRVIAGPVATRVLALFGADVLRVDDPRLPEIEAQHVDTGFGKRSTLLDLRRPADRTRFDELVADADVVVTGYRPAALDRFGLSPEALRRRRPDLVVARLSAWGFSGPWARRRGFDSLVQAATGIADVERRADGTPGALPAQALDHGTGYLLAAAVLRALTLRVERGGAWSVELSLARTARWLLHELPAEGSAGPASAPDPSRWCEERDAPVGRLRYALPPVCLPGGPRTWATPPSPWGADPPAWLPS